MADPLHLPSLRELGPDLVQLSSWRRVFSLALPFLWCVAYFVCALAGWWSVAFVSLVALSFVTYGSISHDLVHRNLGLPRTINQVLLSVIELLALRSGHAYQAAHLYHHAHYPGPDDIEASAARKSFLGAIVEGFTFQPRIWCWALKKAKQVRGIVIAEGIACATFAALAVALTAWTPIFLVYAVLMIMGSWIIPLVTSWIPHTPEAKDPLFQTRAFRGRVASIIALEHLYHLEHHLYPAVPHRNWPELARRLDPYLESAGVKPARILF